MKIEEATGEEIALSLAQAYEVKDQAIGTIRALLAELERRKQQEEPEE